MEEFEAFLAENGREHRTTPPLWPQANGEVERQNRTLMKSIQIAQMEGRDWREEDKVLLRNTKTNKLSPNYNPNPCEVLDRRGGEVTVRNSAGVDIKRNVSFVKKYQERTSNDGEIAVEADRQEERESDQSSVEHGTLKPSCSSPLAPLIANTSPVKQMATPRPTRTIRLPKRFEDFKLSKG